MIEIRSYLRAPDERFVPVEVATFQPPHPLRIPGAIEISIDGAVLLDLPLWDYVDQLWAYIANTTEELVQRGHGDTYFPDQPILLAMQRVGRDRVVVSVESVNVPRRTASTDIRELLRAFYLHGREFFERMSELVPENREANDMAVERLRQSAVSVGASTDTA
jgi:hypothetical protein